MTEKTCTITLDADLLAEAATMLGTADPEATIARALREAVDLEHRRRVLQRPFGITDSELQGMRDARERYLDRVG